MANRLGIQSGGLPSGLLLASQDVFAGDPPPVITANETFNIGEFTATGSVGTDMVEGTMYAGVWPDAATPSIADIKAGTGAVSGTASNQTVSASPVLFPVSGLDENVAYKFHFVQEDASARDSNQAEDSFVTANVAPFIIANPTTAITETTATGNVTTNEQNGTMYGGVWLAAAAPSIADIKAGTGAISGTASSQAVSSGALAFPVTGLTLGTDYKFHFVQTDAATNDSNQVEDAFTTAAPVTPVLSSPTVVSITSSGGTPRVTTDFGSGTLYYVVQLATVGAPSAAQIKAGQDGNGVSVPATSQGTTTVSGTGVYTMDPATALTPDTGYEAWFTHENGPVDAVPVSASFTTLALTKTATVQLADLEGANRANLTGLELAWYDTVPESGVSPTDTSITGSTDGSGNLTFNIPNSTLNNGQTGYLAVNDPTNSWQNIYPVVVVAV